MESMQEILNDIEDQLEEYLQKELERYKLLGYTEKDLALEYVPSKCFSTLYSDNTTYSECFEVRLRPKRRMKDNDRK